VALDSQNRPHAIWTDQSMAYAYLLYSWKTDSGWTPPIDLTTGWGGAEYPDIAIDPFDRIHVVWRAGMYHIFYCCWDGQQWSIPVSLFPLTLCTTPKIAADSQGHVHLVWISNVTTSYSETLYSLHDETGWSAPVNLSNTPTYSNVEPDIAMDSADHPHIVWVEYSGNQDVYYTHFDGICWSAPLTISQSPLGLRCYKPSIAVSNNNHVVAYLRGSSSVPKVFFYTTFHEGNWSDPDTLSPAPVFSSPIVQYDNQDNLHATISVMTSRYGSELYHLCYLDERLLPATLTPQGSLTIPSTGGSFTYTVRVENLAVLPVTCDAWVDVVLPNGAVYGPVLQRPNLTLNAGAVLERPNLVQTVPPGAPAGQYFYRFRVGDISDSLVVAADSFSFTKLGVGDLGLEMGEGWMVTGWENEADFGGPCSVVAMPETASLSASPNPFNPQTVARFELRDASHVRLRVYETTGREVTTLVEGWRDAGLHEVTFDASGLPSGLYLLRMEAGDFTQVQKLVLLK